MTVIGYARVSTEEQASGGVSLEDQKRRIAAYCELYGHELVSIEVDGGFSGKDLNRPGAQVVLEALRSGRVQGVVIAKLDRWTRRLRDLIDLVDLLDSKKAALLSIGETLDTSTATGRMVVHIIGAVMQMEREVSIERTKAGLAHKRAVGEKLGGAVPYGFAVEVREGRKMLVKNPSEQAVIADVLRLRATGLSLDRIASALNASESTTREGGAWKRQYIHRILLNSPA